MSKLFRKRVENFVCENCGAGVVGNGYTNHCPKCLFSKHVDVNPGDRAESCGGLMEPIAVEGSQSFSLIHRCARCGMVKRNAVSTEDNRDQIIALAGRNPR